MLGFGLFNVGQKTGKKSKPEIDYCLSGGLGEKKSLFETFDKLQSNRT